MGNRKRISAKEKREKRRQDLLKSWDNIQVYSLKELYEETKNGKIVWFLTSDILTPKGYIERGFATNDSKISVTGQIKEDAIVYNMSIIIKGRIVTVDAGTKGLALSLYQLLVSKLRIKNNEELIKEFRNKRKLVERKRPVVRKTLKKVGKNDFVIRTNLIRCYDKSHKLEEITGEFCVLSDSKVVKIQVPAAFCPNCNCYFVLRSQYAEIEKAGSPLFKIVSSEVFYKKGRSAFDIKSESILKANGYNVAQSNGMRDDQRQDILRKIVDGHVLTKLQIISYLQFFQATKRGMPQYEAAVKKWEADISFLENYDIGSGTIKYVDSVTMKRYTLYE